MRLKEIHKVVGGQLYGDENLEVPSIAPIEDAVSGELSFLLDKKNIHLVSSTKASAIISCVELNDFNNVIVVKDSRKALAEVVNLFSKGKEALTLNKTEQIDKSAKIHPTATLYSNVSIGPNTSIAENCIIYPNVVIGSEVVIKKNTVIFSNVTLYNRSKIGQNVAIHANSVIGADGFGYHQSNGKHIKIAHIGDVVIGDNVEIGAISSIDRGCLGSTIIGAGTKIDNQVHIGHNVKVGENCILVSQVGLGGSAQLKNNVTVGGQVGVSAIIVGENTVIAAKSGVTKNIEPGSFISGFPAQPHKEELFDRAILKKIINRYKKERKND